MSLWHVRKKLALCGAAFLLAVTAILVFAPLPVSASGTPISGSFSGSGTGTVNYDGGWNITDQTVNGSINTIGSIVATATINVANILPPDPNGISGYVFGDVVAATITIGGNSLPAHVYMSGQIHNFSAHNPWIDDSAINTYCTAVCMGNPACIAACTASFQGIRGDGAFSFDMGTYEGWSHAWSDDGTIIADIQYTVHVSGTATWVRAPWLGHGPPYQVGMNLSINGTYSGTATGVDHLIAQSVSAGPGTVVLSGSHVAELHYTSSVGGTIVMAKQTSNPGGALPKRSLGKFVEVDSNIIPTDFSWPLELRIYYTDADISTAGIDESTLKMYRWDGSSWTQVSDSGRSSDGNGKYVWASLNSFSDYDPMGDPPGGGGGGGAAGVPVFPNVYIGIGAAVGAGIIAFFVRRRFVRQS